MEETGGGESDKNRESLDDFFAREKFFTAGGIIKSIRFNLNIHYAGKGFRE